MSNIPTPIRVALGLAATAVEEARKLPETLPQVPIVAVTTAMQASLRVQQRIAEFAARGDELLSQLRGSSAEAPPWATFDDQPSGSTATESARCHPAAAFDRVQIADHPESDLDDQPESDAADQPESDLDQPESDAADQPESDLADQPESDAIPDERSEASASTTEIHADTDDSNDISNPEEVATPQTQDTEPPNTEPPNTEPPTNEPSNTAPPNSTLPDTSPPNTAPPNSTSPDTESATE